MEEFKHQTKWTLFSEKLHNCSVNTRKRLPSNAKLKYTMYSHIIVKLCVMVYIKWVPVYCDEYQIKYSVLFGLVKSQDRQFHLMFAGLATERRNRMRVEKTAKKCTSCGDRKGASREGARMRSKQQGLRGKLLKEQLSSQQSSLWPNAPAGGVHKGENEKGGGKWGKR